MPDLKQFIITIPVDNWDPDTVARLDAAAGAEGTIELVPEKFIVVTKEDEWLSAIDLYEFVEETGHEQLVDAGAMFDRLLTFNDDAPHHYPRLSPELKEQILRERAAAGIGVNEPWISLRLDINEPLRLVSLTSVIALSSDPIALGCWVPENKSAYVAVLKQWANSLKPLAPTPS